MKVEEVKHVCFHVCIHVCMYTAQRQITPERLWMYQPPQGPEHHRLLHGRNHHQSLKLPKAEVPRPESNKAHTGQPLCAHSRDWLSHLASLRLPTLQLLVQYKGALIAVVA